LVPLIWREWEKVLVVLIKKWKHCIAKGTRRRAKPYKSKDLLLNINLEEYVDDRK
jgi:hypothetical protein